jgi:hypothetical protein
MFYTIPMLANYTVLLQTAADALWTKNSLCVKSPTGHPSAGNITSLELPNSTTTRNGGSGSATGTEAPHPSGTSITFQSSADILDVRFELLALGCVLAFALL